MKLVLASKSPRRAAILRSLGIDFETLIIDVEEKSAEKDPRKYCEEIAKLKYDKALTTLRNQGEQTSAVILASDTIVVYKNEIFGKPKDEGQAREMLRCLSGKSHQVMTSICMGVLGSVADNYINKSEETKITFLDLDDVMINNYLLSGQYKDKAGAYAIQGDNCFFVSKVEGSFTNVVGLPVELLSLELKRIIRALSGNDLPAYKFFKCN